MALFGCAFKVEQCQQVPDAFKACVNKKGNDFKAAAFSLVGDRCASAFVAREFVAGTTEAKAKVGFQIQLAKGGTIGSKFPKKLVFDKVFRIEDGWEKPCFTSAEILVDKMGLLQSSQVVAVPAQVVEVRDDLATLGLSPGADKEQIRKAFHIACRQHHPDKGGDSSKFMAAQLAFETLIGTASQEAAIVLKPTIPALPYEATPAALRAQLQDADENVRILKGKLAAAERHREAVRKVYFQKSKDVEATDRRERAREFTLQFRRSAVHWDIVELRRWFRPECGFFPPKATCSNGGLDKWGREMLQMYGTVDLRSGNEDFDPLGIKFLAWRPCYNANPMSLGLHIKVGMDIRDATDHGKELIVEHRHLTGSLRSNPCALTLKTLGWNREDAERDEKGRERFSQWYAEFDLPILSIGRTIGSSTKAVHHPPAAEEFVEGDPEVLELLALSDRTPCDDTGPVVFEAALYRK